MHAFGQELKQWRSARRMSQLDLSLAADVSSRHISFLETGRSAPSRHMILHLSDVLEVPRERRNDLLQAAGFAAGYLRSGLNEDHMRHMREAMIMMIERHDPYPAIIKDQLWRLVSLNQSATILFGSAGLKEGDSLLDFMCKPGMGRDAIENWGEVGHHVMVRLKNENRAIGGLKELEHAIEFLAADPDVAAFSPELPLSPIINTVYSANGLRLPLFSTFAQFGGAEDLNLAELQIELMFPADDDAKAMLNTIA